MNKSKTKVVWLDILKYGPQTKKLIPTEMISEGFLVLEDEDKIILSEPETLNTRTNRRHPEKKPTFYFIPKVLIKSIETI